MKNTNNRRHKKRKIMTHHNPFIKGLTFTALMLLGGVASAQVVIEGNVYGGGNIGQVSANTTVTVNDGTVGKKLTLEERKYDKDVQIMRVDNGNVYGGGNGYEITGTNPDGSPIFDANAGRVQGNTTVTVQGDAVVRRAVYGGGNIATVGQCTVDTDGVATYTDNTGQTTVTITGNALIGPKKDDLIKDDAGNALDAAVIDTNFKYLGGNEGWVFGSSRGISGDGLHHLSFANNTNVTVNGNAQVMNVFGSGENGHVQNATKVTIGGNAIIGGVPLHGTSTPAAYTVDGGAYDGVELHLKATEGELIEDEYGVGREITRGNVFGGGKGSDFIYWLSENKYSYSSGRVNGNTHVTIQDNAKIYNRVYGGGLLAMVGTFTTAPGSHAITGIVGNTGHTYVKIRGGIIGSPNSNGYNNGDVFGGGRGLPGRALGSGETLLPLHQVVDMAYVGHTHVSIDSTTIMNSVYGGGANGHVQGDAHILIKETDSNYPTTIGTNGIGEWHSNVYGGGGGTARYKDNSTLNLSITAGRVFGDTYLEMTGGHVLHNIYGGGAIASVGTYNATELVNPTHPYLGFGHSNITITGGEIGTDGNNNGMVYGSGRGLIAEPTNFLDYVTYVAYSKVNIGTGTVDPDTGEASGISGNAKINGSVYGSGENGHTYLEAVVNVFGGTIGIAADDYDPANPDPHFPYRGNVYGAGCGTDKYDTNNDGVGDTYNPLAGVVQGNAKVNIYGGYISRSVYGAGAMASVGSFTTEATHTNTNTSAALSWPYELSYTTITDANNVAVTTGKTEVNIRGGHIGTVAAPVALSGNVFGSARGDVGPLGTLERLAIARETEVNINFTPSSPVTDATPNCIIGSVYGSGENGSVYENTLVTMTNGLIGGSMFGGGDGTGTYTAQLKDPTDDHLYDASVYSITSGKVYGNTGVVIDGGQVLHNVYGGGNIASVGKGNYMGYGELPDETNPNPYENSGTCTVTINGGTIGTDGLPDANGVTNGFVFGSSKGTTFVTINNTPRYDYSRDFFIGYANATNVTIGPATGSGSPRIWGSVFGGGDNGHVRWHTDVTVNKGEIGVAYVAPGTFPDADSTNKWVYRGNVYGAGRGIEKIAGTNDYCNSAGSVTLNTNVTVNGGTIHRNVYGGGSNATVGPPPTTTGYNPGPSKNTVSINGGTIGEEWANGLYGGDVFGASRGARDLLATDNINILANSSSTEVSINSGALVIGDVYGGGELGQVKLNTLVNVTGGTTEGSVYGGGKGDLSDEKAALVMRNATVDMTGGLVERSVYGGGELGSVGTFTTYNDVIYNEGQANAFTVQVPKTCAENTGLTTVTMSGGSIGLNGSLMPWTNHNPDDDDRGWIFCGGRGEADSISYPKAIAMGVVGSTYLEISNPTSGTAPLVTASVYGGSENGLVTGNTHVVIAGGQIGTGLISKSEVGGVMTGSFKGAYTDDEWTAAITAVQSGVESSINNAAANFYECDAWEYTYPFHMYDIFANESGYDPQGGALIGTDGHSFFGNVFGGGSGYYPIRPGIWRPTAGQVNGNTHVEITGGHILTSVYGGNEITNVKGKSTVEMSGGTLGVPRTISKIQGHPVTCYLFGGGMGDTRPQFSANTNVGSVEVNITGGVIFGSVFGGGEDGHVLGDVEVNVGQDEGKTTLIGTWGRSYVDGNVFGGGRGFSGTILTAGVVKGNVEMNITGGTMLGSIYGGGRLASVGTYLVPANDVNYGKMMADGTTNHGHVTVNIGGTGQTADITIGNDYESKLHYYDRTTGGNVFAGGMGRIDNLDPTTGYNPKWHLAGRVKNTTLTIGEASGKKTIIKGNVYGGGELGTVGGELGTPDNQNTSITIDGGTIWRDVYGGGYGSDDITKKATISNSPLVQVTPMQMAARVMGNTNITVNGGWVKKSIYGGGEWASVGTVTDSIQHTKEGTTAHPFYISWPYAFTYAANTGKATVNVLGGRIGITGKDYMGPWDNNGVPYNPTTGNPWTSAEIKNECRDNGDIFGGGMGKAGVKYLVAHMGNVKETVVNINYNANTATPTTYKPATTDNPELSSKYMTGFYPDWAAWTTSAGGGAMGCITGSVYGGAEDGHVNTDTRITLTKGLIGHSIYGGGKGKGKFEAQVYDPSTSSYETKSIYGINAGKVYGNTHVTVNATDNTHAYVVRAVYGGGNLGSVGVGNYVGDSYYTTGYGEVLAQGDSHWADTTGTGHSYVTITGGTLGMLPTTSDPESAMKDEIPYGSVFGGCRGMATPEVEPNQINYLYESRPDVFLSYVNNTHVKIGKSGTENGSTDGPRLYGSVFGGAQDGHIRWDANITVNKGEIGANYGTDNVGSSDITSIYWAYRGNVFGGGSGIGLIDENTPESYSSVAGSVTQKTRVRINGGTIHNNVYGGGNLATVGPPTFGETDCPINLTIAKIDIVGGNIGLNNTTSDYGGRVYGSSKGMSSTTNKYANFALCPYTVVNVRDSISGRAIVSSPVIYNAVYGGGEYGQVGLVDAKQPKIHNTKVNIDGGTIKKGVYGGGQGAYSSTYDDQVSGQIMGSTEVNLMGGTIGVSDGNYAATIFGGSRSAFIADNTHVKVGKLTRTDTYEGNITIYGSIFGANDQAGTPYGNATVDVYKTAHTPANTCPEIPSQYTPGVDDAEILEWLSQRPYGDENFAIKSVYGGSNRADYTPVAGKEATVHVYQCQENTIKDVYGGSNAADIGSATASYSTDANVIIDGGRFYRIFGGGNGEVRASNIHGTANTDVNGGLINQVFGGSNNDGVIDEINLNINYGGSCLLYINDVFSGGNAALVLGDVITTVECCNASYGNFYGGTRLANIYGNVTVNIFGATFNNLFAGSMGQLADNTTVPATPAIPADIKKFPVISDEVLTHPSLWPDPTSSPENEELYRVYQYMYNNYYDATNPVDLRGKGGNVTLNIFGGTINEAAYGGSDINGNIEGQITVNVFNTGGTCDLDLFNLYGASRNTAYTPTLSAGTDSPVINIIHGSVKGCVYGGGEGSSATVTASPKVNMGYYADLGTYGTEGDIMDKLFDTIHAHTDKPGHPWVAPTDYAAFVYGNIYGGGNNGQVEGNTTVNVYEGEVGQIAYVEKHVNHTAGVLDSIAHVKYDGVNFGGSVFGGGMGSTSDPNDGRVTGNSTVNIKGGHVLYSVYGGGQMGSVGQHTEVHANPSDPTSAVINFAPVENTGLATVNVTGGQVGPAPKVGTFDTEVYNIPIGLNGLDGYVFGGGKGEGDDPISLDHPYGAYYQFANVNNTLVTVNITSTDTVNNRLWGSVFGGAEDGHVLGDARVNYVSGYMGTKGTTSYDGNIFGGGRNYAHKNYTAGRVAGNTTVEMTGGQLFGNIYGGGRLGVTGMSLIGFISSGGHYQAVQEGTNHGHTKVMVKGGTIGNNKPTSTGDLLIETFSEYSMGSVYGGGMGTLEGIDVTGHPKASSLIFGMTKNTEVEISGTTTGTHVYGIVFGGGEIANVGKYTWTQDPSTLEISNVDVTEGKAKVSISGGTIGADRAKMRYEAGDAPYQMYPKYNDDLGYVYGGGEGYSDDPLKEEAGVRVYPDVNTAFGGGLSLSLLDLMSSVYETEVNISGGWVKASVFGGAESGHVMGNTKVTISGGQIGAGHNYDPTDPDDKLYDNDDFINPLTQPIPSNMYGTYHWKFASPYNPYDPALIANSNSYKPTDGKSWFGNVFGGGSGWFPYVTYNTSTNKYESHWNPISGKVWGDTEVNITGGHILNNVYGANESTDVGGKATVKMSGGTVGVPRIMDSIAARPLSGYVFGGGCGDPRSDFNLINNVDSTNVQITGGIIYGSVYGGAEDGHVLGNTKLTISETDATNKPTVIGCSGETGFDGNAFGGGRNFLLANYTAGRVGGNVKVLVAGGHLLGSLYGGGLNAITGANEYGMVLTSDPSANPLTYKAYNDATTGNVRVRVKGGVIGNPDIIETFTEHSMGDVYGGGKGNKDGIPNRPAASNLLVSLVQSVDLVIADSIASNGSTVVSSPRIYGSVFGGGEVANLGNYSWNADPNTSEITAIDIVAGTGKATVSVSGGIIGADKTQMRYELDNTSPTNVSELKLKYNDDVGIVYGGGEGLADNPADYPWVNTARFGDKRLLDLMASVGETDVTISGNAWVKSSVYGGAAQGRVLRNTKVTIEGGQIGAVFNGSDADLARYTDGTGGTPNQFVNAATTPITDANALQGCDHWDYNENTLNHFDLVSVYNGYNGSDYTYVPTDGKTWFGNVFGGGSGYYPYITGNPTDGFEAHWNREAGKVYGNSTVNITGGHILTSVYGGCETTDVGMYTYNNTIHGDDHDISIEGLASNGTATVTMSGGTVGVPRTSTQIVGHPIPGYVYGSGKGDARIYFNTWTNVNETQVTVTGGKIYGGIFGGGEDGHVLGNSNVSVSEDATDNPTIIGSGGLSTFDGNVFGAGRGTTAEALTAGSVSGNVTLNVSGGKVLANVYGGGNRGSVGTYLVDKFLPDGTTPNSDYYGKMREDDGSHTYGYTTVTISGGRIGNNNESASQANPTTIGGNVFGGGRGIFSNASGSIWPSAARVKQTKVYIQSSAVVKASVYGGGQIGSVRNDATVYIQGGTIGTAYGTTPGTDLFHYGSVYGGGQGYEDLSAVNDSTKAAVYLAGRVYGNTTVNLSGGQVLENVFGGGKIASVGWVKDDGTMVNSASSVNMTGGQVGPLDMTGLNGYVYGGPEGSQNAGMKEYCNVNTTVVIVNYTDNASNRVWGSLFGGGSQGHVLGHTSVTLTKGTIGTDGTTSWDGNIFGGGRNYNILSLTAGRVGGNVNVTMSGGTLKGNIFGGGRQGLTGVDVNGDAYTTNTIDHGNITVLVSGGTVGTTAQNASTGHVFGGGKGRANSTTAPLDYTRLGEVRSTNVTITGTATVNGSVYGGSENGWVLENASATVAGSATIGYEATDLQGYVFGGGRGVDGDENTATPGAYVISAGRVKGQSRANINGGTVKHHVFGGGYKGIVEGERIVNINGGTVENDVYGGSNVVPDKDASTTPPLLYPGHGNLKTVNVRGGIIKGDVYGSSRSSDEGTGAANWSSFVNITGGTIGDPTDPSSTGNVYGAGYEGEVNGSVSVNIGLAAVQPTINTIVTGNTLYKDGLGGSEPTPAKIKIKGSVFDGSDYYGTGQTAWNTYDVEGSSYTFLDGTGYDTENDENNATGDPYMNISGGLYGCGTHCESGKTGREILVRNYGVRSTTTGDEMTNATRTLTTIQRGGIVLLDNANVKLSGAPDISERFPNRIFGVLQVDNGLYIANASGVVLGSELQPAHMDSIKEVRSLYLISGTSYTQDPPANDPDTDPYWEWIGIKNSDNTLYHTRGTSAGTALSAEAENVILFMGDSRMRVRYKEASTDKVKYGALTGFFRMQADNFDPVGMESFAYARPKLTNKVNPLPLPDGTGNYPNQNQGDGGFLSYDNTYNDFTTKDKVVLGYPYPATGDDGGNENTKTKQYPYYNISQLAKNGNRADLEEYREWVLPELDGNMWYVDGRGNNGGWGRDETHANEWGSYPDKPKLTLTGVDSSTGTGTGVCNDPVPGLIHSYIFNPAKDIIFVVGAINADLEQEFLNLSMQDANHHQLRLFRYPGGHPLSNGKDDDGTGTAPADLSTWTGLTDPTSQAGPGVNLGAMVNANKTSGEFVMENVLIDGLYEYTSTEKTEYKIPDSYATAKSNVSEPLVVTAPGAKLTLKGNKTTSGTNVLTNGTILQRGYNNTDASGTYGEQKNYYLNPDFKLTSVHNGGAMFVDSLANVKVEGLLSIEGNEQKNGSGKITSNVYLHTFDTKLSISNTLDQDNTLIGITNPIRNRAATYADNTLSPVAVGTRTGTTGEVNNSAIDAQSAWEHRNFTDDLDWFFVNGHNPDNSITRTTYYNPTSNESTLYLGWTWANVVREVPAGYTDDGTNVTISSREGLVWFTKQVNGLFGGTPSNFSGKTVKQTQDLDMVQYVWVPAGGKTPALFSGTYDGQGHLIENLSIAYTSTGDRRYGYSNYGLFGNLASGTINRTFVVSGKVEKLAGDVNIGGLAARVTGTNSLISNSEAAMEIHVPDQVSSSTDVASGGLVGRLEGGEIHSSMAMPSINANNYTSVGGLVGYTGSSAQLNNSFAHPQFKVSGTTSTVYVGGLVGNNSGSMKNNYIRLQSGNTHLTSSRYGELAYNNSGTVSNCYGFKNDKDASHKVYPLAVAEGTNWSNCHYFAPVSTSDTYGYMYMDNQLYDTIGGEWVKADTSMMVKLNEYVATAAPNGFGGEVDYARWYRPTIDGINGDLPVLLLSNFGTNPITGLVDKNMPGLGEFRSMATYGGGPALQYGGPVRDASSTKGSGEIDEAIDRMTASDELLVYGDITVAPTKPANWATFTGGKIAIHEDAAILFPGSFGETGANVYVGVTFDNSSRHATDVYGNTLHRDWHMFSTPLKAAPLGVNYNGENTPEGPRYDPWDGTDELPTYGFTGDGYFPTQVPVGYINTIDGFNYDMAKYKYPYDFYTWYEPRWQWINFKRNGPSHWHYDEQPGSTIHHHIDYKAAVDSTANLNETIFVPGKGYMMAIHDNTYMQSHGQLNAGDASGEVKITLTNSKDSQTWTWVPDAYGYYGNNFVGNPFHAYLDFDAFKTDNSSFNSYYTYDADASYTYNIDYLIYPTGGSVGGYYASQYLHPHQGFFLQTNDATKEITFSTTQIKGRENAGISPFRDWRPAYPLVNLFAYDSEGHGDVVVIEFNRPENGGGKKAKALRSGNHLIYAHNGDTDYGAFFAVEGTERVPVRFLSFESEQKPYTLRWETHNGFFHSLYLIDNLLGITYDMLANDSYTFVGSKEDYASRFVIVFNVTDVEEKEDFNNFAFFNGSGSLVVNGTGRLEVIDVTGRILYTEDLYNDQNHVNLSRYAKGVYTLRLWNSDKARTQKIVMY